ncbi:uncharacterized protein [Temnothorax longispinosus]|uniref:uncharacterized protein n=1 Tax=Temnothorax longispinosus TaxID=300112 RepID=UPI003A98DEBF
MRLATVMTLIVVQHFAKKAKPETAPSYEIRQFSSEPGIYFERTGQLQQVEATWKLAIKIDVAALGNRYHQLQEFLQQAEEVCETIIAKDTQQTCKNILHTIEKNNKKLTQLLTRLQTIYKTNNNKRGLIDAIGTISKTLFGTMDADDAKHIQEQLELIQNQQQTLRHTAKSQLKVINATIGHMEALEKSLYHNEQLMTNVTRRLQLDTALYAKREEIDEQLLILTAITEDLMEDVKDTIDYLTYSREGVILTRLLPIEKIITELKEATSQLTQGSHFLFKTRVENWNEIQNYVEINAYYDKPNIYTIIKFPVVAYPVYDIIKTTPLPVPNHANIFTFLRITHNILAIDKENHNYITLEERDLNDCKRNGAEYVCDRNCPIYFVGTNAPCEVQVYVGTPGYVNACERRQMVSDVTLWVALSEPQAWLFSAPRKQKIAIQCNDQAEQKVEIERTGKLSINENCKLTTPDIIIKTKRQTTMRQIEMHLADFNLTLTNINKNINEQAKKEIRLEPVIRIFFNVGIFVDLSDCIYMCCARGSYILYMGPAV